MEGVCKLLDNLEEVSASALGQYRSVLKENNVNGRVLLHCDMDELKKLLRMNFGDWEMFRVMIVSLRQQEMTVVMRQDEAKNVRFVAKNTATVLPKERRGSGHKSNTSVAEADNAKVQGDGNVNRNKQSVMEKQVS